MDSPIIWSHRGQGIDGIKNTLSSFKKCVHIGVDGIKTEAHLSHDGCVILRFLPYLIIEEKKVSISDLIISAIKDVKVENDEPVPTLRETFEDCGDKVRYNFDIWDYETGKIIIDIAEEYNLLEKIELTKPANYKHPFETLLKPLREKNKDIILINSLFSETQITQDNYLLLDQMKTLNVQVVNLRYQSFNLELFNRVKKASFNFYVWGVRELSFMKKFYNLNYKGEHIDGIYSSFPEKLIDLRAKR